MNKKYVFLTMVICFGLIAAGCSVQGKVKSYSSENGDVPPIDMTNVEMLAVIKQVDTMLSPILVSVHLKNNGDAAFVDVFMIEISCADGSTGNVTYSGDILPGEAAELTGVLTPKTAGKEYYLEDLTVDRMLTSFDAGEGFDSGISYYPQTFVYEWDIAPV